MELVDLIYKYKSEQEYKIIIDYLNDNVTEEILYVYFKLVPLDLNIINIQDFFKNINIYLNRMQINSEQDINIFTGFNDKIKILEDILLEYLIDYLDISVFYFLDFYSIYRFIRFIDNEESYIKIFKNLIKKYNSSDNYYEKKDAMNAMDIMLRKSESKLFIRYSHELSKQGNFKINISYQTFLDKNDNLINYLPNGFKINCSELADAFIEEISENNFNYEDSVLNIKKLIENIPNIVEISIEDLIFKIESRTSKINIDNSLVDFISSYFTSTKYKKSKLTS